MAATKAMAKTKERKSFILIQLKNEEREPFMQGFEHAIFALPSKFLQKASLLVCVRRLLLLPVLQ